jgi:hypothetical protein
MWHFIPQIWTPNQILIAHYIAEHSKSVKGFTKFTLKPHSVSKIIIKINFHSLHYKITKEKTTKLEQLDFFFIQSDISSGVFPILVMKKFYF